MTDWTEIDKKALASELTDAFIQYQHRLENPMPTANETLYMLKLKYHTDTMFRLKVDSLVAGVMQIVSKHIKD